MRLVPIAANALRGFAAYLRRAGGSLAPKALDVLTLDGPDIATMTLFLDEHGRMFEAFGMPKAITATD